MIRAVFLDVGGTLIHPFPSVGAIYAEAAARHGVNADAADLQERFARAWRELKKSGKPVAKAWWKAVVEETFAGFAFADPQAFFEDVYRAFTEPGRWRVFDDVRPALEELKRRGQRLAVVSNWDERLPALLDALALTPYFERRFISFDVGVSKPDPAIFRRALADMRVSPLEAIHVGDDPEEDVAAAEAAGLRAYLLIRGGRPVNSRQITDLSELLVRV